MKVLMFGWEFPPHISGGLGTACLGLSKGFATLPDVNLTFVVPKAWGDEDQSTMNLIGANQIRVSERTIDYKGFSKHMSFVEINSKIIPYSSPDEYFKLINQTETEGRVAYVNTGPEGHFQFTGKYGNSLFQEISDYSIVASILGSDLDFDIIHAHDWLTYPAGIAAKRVSGKPLVIHVHATDFDRSGGSVNPAVFNIEKEGMEVADRIITVSNLTRDIVINKYGINPDKVFTVYNAVEPLAEKENLNIKKGFDDKIVTFLGRITFQKGPEYFIEAANKVLKRMDNVRFVMAGSGDMMNRMVRRAAKLGITDRFHFTGFLAGDDVYRMYALSDVYVMPSVSEPFGIAPLEALQSNVPVIISRQSGVAEVLKHAIKVDFWDIDAMADAIYGILKYDALSDTFKKMGKAEVDSLKWENSASQLRDIYQTLL
jgi:glycosyltransferase involved in cell wall biosynthesis